MFATPTRTYLASALALAASVYVADLGFNAGRASASLASHLSFSTTPSSPPSQPRVPSYPTSAMSSDLPLSETATVTLRPWFQRGHADHDWLRTFHTFSFADYFDPRFMGFSNLRVINEDRVAPSTGFPPHPHSGAEIFSIVLSGELTHKDSMGNVETLRPGQVQFTSAGTGVVHSEYNNNRSTECHFLQIWYTPDERNLPPRYYTASTTDWTDRLVTLIKPWSTLSKADQARTGLLPEGEAIPSHSSLVTRASLLSPGKSVAHPVGADTDVASQEGTERWIYTHVASLSGYRDPDLKEFKFKKEGNVVIKTAKGDVTLTEGDGAFIKKAHVGEKIVFESTGQVPVEFIVFDLAPKENLF